MLYIYIYLPRESYKPYRKPNDKPQYINVDSNHPPNIIKNLPKMIEKRLSGISSSEAEFDGGKREYEQALEEAGYDNPRLSFKPRDGQGVGRKRRRRIIWFNPPWAKNVEGNVAKWFNAIVARHFKKNTLFGRLFNKNNLRVSYSCTRNVQAIISASNRRVLNSGQQQEQQQQKRCNCRRGVVCPAGGNCLAEGVVYEAKVSAENVPDRTYIGCSATSLKLRINNHRCDFRNAGRRNSTTLSAHVWSLKEAGKDPDVSFRILRKAKPYSPVSRKCTLCTMEKLFIAKGDERVMLNKKSEIGNKCRHRNRHLLGALIDNG